MKDIRERFMSCEAQDIHVERSSDAIPFLSTFQIDRTEEENDGTANSEMRTADIANDYDATVKAFRGADAVIHLAAIPNPVDKDDWKVHK